MAYLVVFARDGAPPQRVALSKSKPTVVGRAIDCALWLEDPELSRQHCNFEHVSGKWIVNDLGSRNGTFAGDQRVAKSHILKDGQTIHAGGVRIVFHASERATSNRPSDPVEASRARAIESQDAALEETQLPAAPRQLTTPKPQPAKAESRTGLKPAVPLAFQRPPARPIVGEGKRPEDPGVSSSWFSAVVSRLRQGRDDRKR
jgi:pSer/pThr/pTyr-binding forkhead associated (FHA) protein